MDIILNYIQTGFSAVFAFVVLLGLLIFIHELGHFAVAKMCGVRVEVFSLGFGKKILKYKKGDTTYALSLIPLGGYVKMFGDELNAQISESEKKFSFTHKPLPQRYAIVLAGPLMNFFFAIVLFAIVAILGEETRAPIIGDLSPNSAAYSAGFRAGDHVLQAGSENITSWDQFQTSMNKSVGQTLTLKVQRPGFPEPVSFSITPEPRANPNILSTDALIGDVAGLTFLSQAPIVGVRANSPAAKAGLKTGDRLVRVNNVEAKHFRDLDTLMLPHQGAEVIWDVERSKGEGQGVEKLKLPVNFRTFPSVNVLGIESSELYLFKIMPNSPAERAGLKQGDRLVAIGDKEPQVWEDVLNSVKSFSGDGDLNLKIQRDGEVQSIALRPEMTSQMNLQGGEEKRFTIGIVPWIELSTPELVPIKLDNPLASIKRGWDRTWDVTVMTVVSFVRLFQNKISPKSLGGVISIGQAAHETFKIGITHYLTMMAAISVNLFILNLLPIPVLDGGHLLFYTIEALKGAPLSMRKMEIAQQVGLFLLMSLMVFALFNDVSRIFGFW